MQPGLTLVVGPPGTGKTDVAVQIISNLYHNFPEQVSAVTVVCMSCLGYSAGRVLCLECRVSWVRVPLEAAYFSKSISDCLGCAVLLCLDICLTLLASFFLPSLISLTCYFVFTMYMQ